MSEPSKPKDMTKEQALAIIDLAVRYNTTVDLNTFIHLNDLPEGYFAGQVGPIYVGVSPLGCISS